MAHRSLTYHEYIQVGLLPHLPSLTAGGANSSACQPDEGEGSQPQGTLAMSLEHENQLGHGLRSNWMEHVFRVHGE